MSSAYGPFSSGTITFRVGDSSNAWIEDPATGNYIPGPNHTITLQYEVSLSLSPASNNNAPGTELVQYYCQGCLLKPAIFDPRVSIGAVGTATLQGLDGRFILTEIGVSMEPGYRSTLRQRLAGTFELVGAGSSSN